MLYKMHRFLVACADCGRVWDRRVHGKDTPKANTPCPSDDCPSRKRSLEGRCECADRRCKAVPWHKGATMQVHGETLFEGTIVCERPGEMHLFRVHMGDAGRPVVFCEPCGDDALDSGVFVADSETREVNA